MPELDYTPQSIEGRNVIVTGGTTGIGRAIALMLTERGARVLICGRHEKEMNDAISDSGNKVLGVIADMSTESGVKTLFETADAKLGEIDVVVCNAALPGGGVENLSYNAIQSVIHTNITGYLACAQEAAERMKKRSQGHIIFIGSLSADSRKADSSLYVATKCAIQGFSESFRQEMGEHQIRVSLIEPGRTGSDMQKDKESHEQKAREKKMLKAEDIAACVIYCLTQPARCDISVVKVQPLVHE